MTFTNVRDNPLTATASENAKFGGGIPGRSGSGESKTIIFDKPGTYFYICTPHPRCTGR